MAGRTEMYMYLISGLEKTDSIISMPHTVSCQEEGYIITICRRMHLCVLQIRVQILWNVFIRGCHDGAASPFGNLSSEGSSQW